MDNLTIVVKPGEEKEWDLFEAWIKSLDESSPLAFELIHSHDYGKETAWAAWKYKAGLRRVPVSDRTWHLCVFGALTIYSIVARPWWVTVAVVIVGVLFFPIDRK